MSAPHIILDCLPSLCQKLSDLVEVWHSYNKTICLFFLRHGVYYNIKLHYFRALPTRRGRRRCEGSEWKASRAGHTTISVWRTSSSPAAPGCSALHDTISLTSTRRHACLTNRSLHKPYNKHLSTEVRHLLETDWTTMTCLLTLWRPLLPDQVKPSFVIFDIRALWCSPLSVRVPGWQKLQMMA